MNDAAIGVFDSGMGGLTVMRALMQFLPNESFIYLGDTARLPYGTKSAETVRRYAIQASQALMARGVKLIVVACNTASVSLPTLTEALSPLPVIGVIEPGAEAALAATPTGPIAVLATEGTVNGGAYLRAIAARSSTTIVQQACPLLVPMAEEGLIAGPIVDAVIHRYLDTVFAGTPAPKCLLLGCTHYPVLKPAIAEAVGPQVVLVDSAEATANAVAQLVTERGLSSSDTSVSHRFLATDSPDRFARVGEIFLGAPIDPGAVELIDLQ